MSVGGMDFPIGRRNIFFLGQYGPVRIGAPVGVYTFAFSLSKATL